MGAKKKDARGYVGLYCTECKEKSGVTRINYYVEKSKTNTPELLELNKNCPTCKKHTIHKEKK